MEAKNLLSGKVTVMLWMQTRVIIIVERGVCQFRLKS